jgi:hypothetical protein
MFGMYESKKLGKLKTKKEKLGYISSRYFVGFVRLEAMVRPSA